MEDIEDMFKNESVEDQQQRRPIRGKVARAAKKAKPATELEDAKADEAVSEAKPVERNGEEGDALPGKAKVFVKTYGCSHNISDSEYMAGLL